MSDQQYTGVARAISGTSDYNALQFVIQQTVNRMATFCPVVVKAVNLDGDGNVTSVDVQPMVSQLDGAGNAVPHGTIHGLPVMRWQGGSCGVIIDPAVGDNGTAAFAHVDISSVKKTRKVANPGSRRKFDWSDGVYLGGILNDAPTQSIRISGSGVEITAPTVAVSANLTVGNGASGVFTTADGQTVTVVSGIVTEIA
jgi:hypothetical protein